MEPGASKVTAVGSPFKSWGYKDKDVQVLQQMLVEENPRPGAPGESFRIHLVLRRVLLAYHGAEAVAFACVAWALTSPTGELVFKETFYAADHTSKEGAKGVKKRIHIGITERVHTNAHTAASGGPPAGRRPWTFDDYESAAEAMPDALGVIPVLDLGRGGATRRVEYVGETGEEFARCDDSIDWFYRLGIDRPVEEVALHADATHSLKIASVEMEPGAAKVTHVGTYKVGKYDSKDLRVLENMLKNTNPIPGSVEESFRAHVLVRSFSVMHSNEKGAGLACVAWALTNPAGELVFDEQFYASRDSPPLSVGGIKNRMHEGITKRVLLRAQDIASERPLGPSPEDTYDDFERAASRVPDRLRSEHPTIFGGYDQLGNKVGIWRSVTGESGEHFAQRRGAVDWYRRLGIPRPPDAPAPPETPSLRWPMPSGYPASSP